MRRKLTIVILAILAASPAMGQSGRPGQAYASWRPMAYQLPGAYRFLDRLDLTEEQQTALGKIYKEWQTQRRELYSRVMSTIPPLSPEDRKDADKVRKYYERRRDVYQSAQIPMPIALISDILSEEQLGKIVEAGKLVEGWDTWLKAHMTKYDQKLDKLLGPAPNEQNRRSRYVYQALERVVEGASLFGRMKLSEAQAEGLKNLRARYYAEYSGALAPLSQSLRNGQVDYAQAAAVRRAVGQKVRKEVADRIALELRRLLTDPQMALWAKAKEIVQERDLAIWERYSQYVAELSHIVPVRPPVTKPKAVKAD
jgi:Spy/CpxP family protein refolding chaperone